MPRNDLIIVNAKITTLDRQNPQAEAVAIRDGKFLTVGSEAEARAALPEAEIAALEEAARTYAAGLAQLREALAELEKQLGVAPFDPAELAQAGRDLTATDADAARTEVTRMCETLLANTVIEKYTVEIL